SDAPPASRPAPESSAPPARGGYVPPGARGRDGASPAQSGDRWQRPSSDRPPAAAGGAPPQRQFSRRGEDPPSRTESPSNAADMSSLRRGGYVPPALRK
ncbi:MAG: hypothetical protein INR71_14190, partial [Terriglobus roseus]|nr:hypothetical protein [Terriglobus roseus]